MNWAHNRKTVVAAIVIAAFAIRVALILLFATYRIPADQDHWAFGYELGRVARSVAEGRGFSSPLIFPTGPTAWFAPLFPLTIAGVFRVFGVYTTGSAAAVLLLDSLLSALTCAAVFWLGSKVFDAKTGLLAAAALAVYPPSIWHAINTIWDTSALALALVLLTVYLVWLRGRTGAWWFALGGALMGAVLLLNPAAGAFYPFALVWLWKTVPGASARRLRNLAALAGAGVLVFGPWMARNYAVLRQPAPRCCLGLELMLGNNEYAWSRSSAGLYLPMHPTNSEEQARLFQRLGETEYNRYSARRAWDFIRNNPGKFAALTLRRARVFWFGEASAYVGNIGHAAQGWMKLLATLAPLPFFIVGLALCRPRMPDAGLLILLLVSFPLTYYFAGVSDRYRFPVEPFILVLAAYGVVRIARSQKREE